MLSNQETVDALNTIIFSDGWTKVLIPMLEKQHASLMNKITSGDPYANKAFELGQLSTIRMFLAVAGNNQRLADRLASDIADKVPNVPFVSGSPYSPQLPPDSSPVVVD